MSAPISEVTDTSIADSEQPNIETLTAEIKMYLHIANQSIIEVGKRLIQAKELVPHGDWQHWLKNNFNLSYRMAAKFIQIAERFGKNQPNSNVPTSAHFDISTFNQTQLVELLALPEGEEEKFIEQKAVEGNPADQMTIKQLRAEINKYREECDLLQKKSSNLEDKLTVAKSSLNSKNMHLEQLKDVAALLQKENSNLTSQLEQRPIDVATEFPADYESTKLELAELKNREDSFKRDFALSQALSQMFALIPTLLNADNLHNVVSASADNDFSSFQLQLSQLASLHSQLQKHLNVWEDSHINKTPIDRDGIIEELKQLALQDMNNLTSALLLALVKSFGFDDMSQVPDELLPVILRKMKSFQAFLLYM